MKILHVVPYYLPATRYGGPIRSVHGLCRALVALGHEVHVCTTSMDGKKDLVVPRDEVVDIEGVKVHYFKVIFLRRLFFSFRMFVFLKKELRNFDLIHLHTIYTCPTLFAARIAHQFAVPYILSPRGMLLSDLIKIKNSFFKRCWIHWVERVNIENARAVHFTSDYEKKDFEWLKFKAPESIVIPNGITLSELRDCENNTEVTIQFDNSIQRPFILFLGRIDRTKRIDLLIKALIFIELNDLVIAGNDEIGLVDELKTLTEENNLTSRVRFLGGVNDQQKKYLLSEASLLVLPSYSESFGLVVLEAMLNKCPVVITEHVGLAQAVKASRSGLVVKATPSDIAEAIDKIIKDPIEAKEMGIRGHAFARDNFSWGVVSKLFLTIYEEILKKSKKQI